MCLVVQCSLLVRSKSNVAAVTKGTVYIRQPSYLRRVAQHSVNTSA